MSCGSATLTTSSDDDDLESPDLIQAFLSNGVGERDPSKSITLRFSNVPDGQDEWTLAKASSKMTLLEILKADPNGHMATNRVPLSCIDDTTLARLTFESDSASCLLQMSMSVSTACPWVESSVLRFPPGQSVEELVRHLDEGESLFMKRLALPAGSIGETKVACGGLYFRVELPEPTMPSNDRSSSAPSPPSFLRSSVARLTTKLFKSATNKKPGDRRSNPRNLDLMLQMTAWLHSAVEVEVANCQ